jgi:hypothetical protein
MPASESNEPARTASGTPSAGFVERLGYWWMDRALKQGKPLAGVTFNGRTLSAVEMERIVAFARRHGFLK